MKNRIQSKMVALDWAELISDIQATGVNSTELSELLDVTPAYFRNIGSDRQAAPSAWDVAIGLLDIHMMVTNKAVPRSR